MIDCCPTNEFISKNTDLHLYPEPTAIISIPHEAIHHFWQFWGGWFNVLCSTLLDRVNLVNNTRDDQHLYHGCCQSSGGTIMSFANLITILKLLADKTHDEESDSSEYPVMKILPRNRVIVKQCQSAWLIIGSWLVIRNDAWWLMVALWLDDLLLSGSPLCWFATQVILFGGTHGHPTSNTCAQGMFSRKASATGPLRSPSSPPCWKAESWMTQVALGTLSMSATCSGLLQEFLPGGHI